MTIRRWLKRVVLGGVALLALLVAGIWVEHSIPVELPRPTGGLPVGRTYRALGPDVAAWIWYPARHNERVVDYLPDTLATRLTRDRAWIINLITRTLDDVRAHGVFEAPFADSTQHPVLLFRGGGGGGVLGYTAHFEELASRGHVVVALEGGSGGNPEACVGRADEEACAERLIGNAIIAMGSALDRLSAISMTDPLLGGRVDLKTVGVFGHSFGGAQAFAFCAADARCKAGVNMDGRLFVDLERMTVAVPFLWLLSDHGDAKDSLSRQVMGQIQRAYERQPPQLRAMAMITGANHFTFSEDGAMLKSGVLRGAMRAMGMLGIRGRRQVEVSAYAVATFFDARLRHAESIHSALAASAYPELVQQP